MRPPVPGVRVLALCAALALPSSIVIVHDARAAWPHDPCVNLTVSGAAQEQSTPATIDDGNGGAFVAWRDYRSLTSWDVYLTHVTRQGAVDAGWPAGGFAVATGAGDQIA